MPTCIMCNSLYVKANGELPCWDDVGEDLILRTLDIQQLKDDPAQSVFYSPQLRHIRQSFLDGKDPHPDYCNRCAVKGYGGGHTSLRPTTMELLHLESSFLCHLSCPQCIPAGARHKLKTPPYHLSPALLEGLLRQLRKEGVEQIKAVHFEGRGDPLMSPDMQQLLEITKSVYPKAFTIVTTHGSYPYKSWVVESGLDSLRVSVDGAFPESYRKYRIGGSLETVLQFLRTVRDEKRRLGKQLQVDWKYILFEWNDSDEELVHAAHLARELDVRLRFILTHSVGRSMRFSDPESLQLTIARIAPEALIESTFQLKEPSQTKFTVTAVIEEEVTALYQACRDAIRRNDQRAASAALSAALEYDPGIKTSSEFTDCKHLLDRHLNEILKKTQFPATFSGVSCVANELSDIPASVRLFRHYLWCALRDALHRRDLSAAFGWGWKWVKASVRLRTRLRQLYSITNTLRLSAQSRQH